MKKMLFGLLLLLLLLLGKDQLHLIGAEIGSAKTYPITKLSTKEKIVALTIDDGPDPRFTPILLDILERYQVPATFFVVGQSCEKYPEIVQCELTEGHEIENHTYTHLDLSKANIVEIEDEIIRNQDVIERLTNKKPQYLRPPKRLFTNNTVEAAQANDHEIILWTVCVENHAAPTALDMAERVIEKAAPGTIILAHDGRLDRSRTLEALPLIIEGYQKKGYRFVRIDELPKSNSI